MKENEQKGESAAFEGHIIAVRIQLEAAAECIFKDVLPTGNFIGLLILATAIQLKIEADGNPCSRPLSIGELNNGLLIVEVENPHRAIESCKAVLSEQYFLVNYATIGFFDERELFCRPVFPVGAAPFVIGDEVKVLQKRTEEVMKRVQGEMAAAREVWKNPPGAKL